jgi:hypothetical protein
MQSFGALAFGIVLGWAATGFGAVADRVIGTAVAAGAAGLVASSGAALAAAGVVAGAGARAGVEALIRLRSAAP